MKNKIILLVVLLPVFANAQTAKSNTDTAVINELIATWAAGLHEEGDEPANIRDFNKFKSLFMPDAVVFDDINGVYRPSSPIDSNPYKTEIKSVENYAHDLALEFRNLSDSIYAITYNTDRLSRDSVITVKLIKKVSGEKYRQYIIGDIPSYTDSLIKNNPDKNKIEKQNKDSINRDIDKNVNHGGTLTYRLAAAYRLRIRIVANHGVLQIDSILRDSIIENVHCLNDQDNDGIIDAEDSCKNLRGDLTAHGCPDNDLDGIPDSRDACKYTYGVAGNYGCPVNYFLSKVSFSVYTGIQMNSVDLNLPELDKLGYSGLDFNESNKGKLKNPGMILSAVAGANLAYYFGSKKKDVGISAGIVYTAFTSTYEIVDPVIYTFKSSDGVDEYRRRITLRSGSEEQTRYDVFNFPLLFTYRFMPGNTRKYRNDYKWNIDVSAGPSYLLFKTTSKYNSNIDFEGLYQIDTITGNAITYYDYFDNGSSYNIFLTSNGIKGQSGVPGADSVFSALNHSGYDFASDKNYKGSEKNANKSGIAFNAKLDATYKLDNKGKALFMFGASVLFAPLPDQSKGYTLVDKTTDPYHSIYNSHAKSDYFTIGLNAGFVFQW